MADAASRLDLISTRWTLLERAHDGAEAAAAAQACLLERYGGAARRYLLGALKDPDGADELFQEFAYRFLHGDFKGACPERGRFRDFLKGALRHLVADFCNRRRRQLPRLPDDLASEAPDVGLERLFQESWRDHLLTRTWDSLAEEERQTGQPFYSALRLRADRPELRSPELAQCLGEALHRPLSAPAVRQILHRARKRFAGLLRLHVQASLSSDAPEAVEDELRDLGLWPYVQERGDAA
jgi:DNA-directed RNA polymerase specialized sigma24 family protein